MTLRLHPFKFLVFSNLIISAVAFLKISLHHESCRKSLVFLSNSNDNNVININSVIKENIQTVSKIGVMLLASGTVAHAIETDTNTDVDINKAKEFVSTLENTRELNSDEFIIQFNDMDLGIAISENSYNGFPVCTVSKILNTNLVVNHPELRIQAIITQINNTKVDGIPLREIAKIIKESPRPIIIKFRDPSRYFELLDSLKGRPQRVITSSYLPANTRDVGAPEQIIRVERLELPAAEDRLSMRSSQLLDVMEIQYVAQIQGSTEIVDSSALRAPPGSSTRSIYYVLGQRNGPPGKFPPGWDLTIRGMVVGEKRRITLPYTLAYDRKGNKDLKIPPFANMIYTVKLISLT